MSAEASWGVNYRSRLLSLSLSLPPCLPPSLFRGTPKLSLPLPSLLLSSLMCQQQTKITSNYLVAHRLSLGCKTVLFFLVVVSVLLWALALLYPGTLEHSQGPFKGFRDHVSCGP